ncbi:integral membrane protein [Lophiotrema nucula]|uniref:Integral membrane protein n=1 Tax=Lophiotrema nucula TaxID=690887 RepID=A0A6A5YQ47_9PLEO|nr:integral membrane protein [Lophiotrema nucula]
MIISRTVSIILRFGEFVSAAVVLGLAAHFLNQYDNYRVGPLGREVYTIIIAALSVIFSVVWLIPTTASMLHYPADLFLSAAWFAAFGVLVNWIEKVNCGGIFSWGIISVRHNSYCGQWKAAEAFSFISACFWFASFLLGVFVYHKLSRDPVVTDGHRRRWRRSRV